jgi:aminoglycoside/choline kinase family phosphotransferase
MDTGIPDRITRFLRDHESARGRATIVPLTGDASDRQYFRASFTDRSSIVLALHAGPIERASLPFVNVATLFSQIPLPIPAIVGHSDELGILALDDLGDVTLQACLATASAAERTALYRQAVALIERLQRRGADLASEGLVPYRVVFDIEKLTWELAHFVRHFLEAHRRIVLSADERAALDEEWLLMATELAGEPRVLCHRDYHSRNLMVRDGGLVVIDFQDARMGPDTYDLASLLRDSYVDLSDRERDDLVRSFLALKPAEPGEFRRRFDLMSLQRNLKALGTFGYQTTTRQNDVYLQYVPRTLAHARVNLLKYERFTRLRALLARHVSELAR